MPGRRWLAGVTLLAFLAAWGPLPMPRTARAAQTADVGLAKEHYDFAEFGKALEILDGVLAGGRLAGNDLRDVQVLRARCLVGLGEQARAADAFCAALRIDRAWRPDVDLFPKAERDVFDQALASCESEPAPAVAPPVTPTTPPRAAVAPAAEPAKAGKPWYTKPFALVAGGLLLVGGVIGLSGGGGGDDGGGGGSAEPLPDFPPPPPRLER